MLFVFAEAVVALGIISAAAYLTKLPLLFPPLGPSAFVLFRTPMSAAACPRSVILSHAIALGIGLLFLQLSAALFPESVASGLLELSWPRVAAIALSMGAISIVMIALGCSHPPAAATAIIAAMGYFHNPLQIGGFLAAVGLLVAQAFLFHRLLGGLPYPRWRSDPTTARFYGQLAGIGDESMSFWDQLSARVFQRRSKSQGGFTLVELLIVVVILTVLAGIVVPKLISPTEDAKTSALEANLAIMNKAIEIYSLEHRGNYPGTIGGETTWDNFVEQMTLPTDKDGEPGEDYGPYLRTGIPLNPFTGTRTGFIYSGIEPANLRIGWYYDATNGVMYGRSQSGGGVIIEDGEPRGGDAVPRLN